MLPILLFVAAAWMTLSAVMTIAIVGKPREPITGGVAAFTVLIVAGIVALLILAGVALIH